MASEFALRLDKVTKRYGEYVAVNQLSFDIPAGVIYGVLGPNGAGKTTCLRMINDIILPDEGEVTILDGLKPGRAAAQRIGYLPEERGMYPKMRVLDMLSFFAELRGLSGREAKKRARQWLDRLQIGDWKKNKVQDLSKGMQQKVQFAAALIHEPELLILDEPWSGLDPINAEVLKDIVLEQKQAGRTILFSTHLMEQAEQICDSVCIIARGKRVVEGELDAVRRAAASDRMVALDFTSDADVARARESVLADASLVRAVKEKRGEIEVELAGTVEPKELLVKLMDADLSVRKFELVEPTLHQIFVDKVSAESQPFKEEQLG